MKKAPITKTQNQKKEQQDKLKGKDKQKGKEKEKENKKNKKVEKTDSEEEYYTKEEIELLDKYHDYTKHHFIDDEIYDVMLKCKNDENMIKAELDEMLKVLKRGEEFEWTEIGKSNSIFLIFNLFII